MLGCSFESLAGGLSQPLYRMDCRIKSGNDERKKRRTKSKRKAERRETLFRNHRTIGCGSASVKRQLAFRRSTTALTQRTRHPKGSASGQASWEEAPKHGLQAASTSTHFQRCTSRTGRNAGRLMPELPGSRVQAHPRAPPPLRQPACLPISVLHKSGMIR